MTALRSDAARNRQRLISAAETVFAEHGLDAGVEEIAQLAGVGIGTLYRRFPTKDALIAELVRELLTQLLAQGHEALDDTSGAGLERFLHGTAQTLATHRGCLARLWNDAETVALKAEIRDVMARLLTQAQEHGRVRSDATTSDLDLILWSLRGVIESANGLDAAWRRHLAVVMAGLRPTDTQLAAPAMSAEELAVIRQRTAELAAARP